MRVLQSVLGIGIISIGLYHCSMESPTQVSDGGGIETIAGKIITSDGEVAQNTQVMLIPQIFNPVNETLPESMIDTTDSSGEYRFTVSDSSYYNIEAVNLTNGNRSLKSGVSIAGIQSDDDLIVDTLKQPGAIKVSLPDAINLVSGYIYILGTDIQCNLNNQEIINGKYIILDSVPAALVSNLFYCIKNDPSTDTLLIDTITVSPNDTVGNVTVGLLCVYNKDNSGVPSNNITSVVRDKTGTMWIGTDNGLTQFFGTTWKTFTTNNSDLPGNNILDLAVDNDGSIWVGTSYGMVHINDNTWTEYTPNNSGIVDEAVYVISIDSKGTKWIGTDYGVNTFTGTEWRLYNCNNSKLPNNIVYTFTHGPEGTTWIGTNSGVAGLNGSTWTVFESSESPVANKTVYDMAVDAHGVLWIATRSGVVKYEGDSWIVYDVFSTTKDFKINGMAIDAEGNKWFVTGGLKSDNGYIVKFDDVDWTIHSAQSLNMPLYPFYEVNDIFIDDNNNLLIGTCLDGVLVMGP